MGKKKQNKHTFSKHELARDLVLIPAGMGKWNKDSGKGPSMKDSTSKAFWEELCDEETMSLDMASERSIGETRATGKIAIDEAKEGTTPKAPWTGLFKDNRKHGNGFVLHMVENQTGDICIHNDELDDLDDWGFCLIGYFTAKFPGNIALNQVCKSWGVNFEYFNHGSGWLVFKFESDEDREKVLVDGPYFVYGRQLLLKIMPALFRFDDKEFSSMPIWINLYGLPLECWNAKVLSEISSRVGKPICTDKLTCTKERISFARVLVEVDVSIDLVRMVKINLPDGTVLEQRILYEYEQEFCSLCKLFGHSTEGCRFNIKAGLRAPYKPQAKANGSEKQGQGIATLAGQISKVGSAGQGQQFEPQTEQGRVKPQADAGENVKQGQTRVMQPLVPAPAGNLQQGQRVEEISGHSRGGNASSAGGSDDRKLKVKAKGQYPFLPPFTYNKIVKKKGIAPLPISSS